MSRVIPFPNYHGFLLLLERSAFKVEVLFPPSLLNVSLSFHLCRHNPILIFQIPSCLDYGHIFQSVCLVMVPNLAC